MRAIVANASAAATPLPERKESYSSRGRKTRPLYRKPTAAWGVDQTDTHHLVGLPRVEPNPDRGLRFCQGVL